MEVIFYFVFLTILILISCAYLLQPLLKSGQGLLNPANSANTKIALLEERDRAYQALTELDADYEAGNLSESDYQDLRAQYKEQAVQALISLDAYDQANNRLSEALEAEISRVRTEMQIIGNKKKALAK
jgi:hypothetical protein